MLLGLLAIFHVKAEYAALAGLCVSLLIAIGVYQMPAKMALLAAANGAAYGLFPIGWIVLTAIFTYDISVATGKFDVLTRFAARVPQHDGRSAAHSVLFDRSVLADLDDDGLARHARSMAGVPSCWSQLWHHAIRD